jgi:type II secretory pathway component GspD/PulD (secretin)
MHDRATWDHKVITPKFANAQDIVNTVSTILSQANRSDDDVSTTYDADTSVTLDARSNSVIVSGSENDVSRLAALVKSLDVSVPLVYLECLVMTVTSSDLNRSGIESLNLKMTPFGENISFSGFSSSGVISPDSLSVVLEASRTRSDVNIEQTPSLVVRHNHTGRISVGESRPVVSGVVDTEQASRSSVDYLEIGLDLKITPFITDSEILLQLDQSQSTISDTVVLAGESYPVLSRRTTASTFSVAPGETLVFGGLKQKTKRRVKSFFFGFIPAGSSSETINSELIVMITAKRFN